MKPEFTGEVILRPSFAPRPGISHVLFDFDGTLSLIRQGWPEVMVPMFVEVLPPPARRDRRPTAAQLVFDDIMRLNGKQTIYQMIQLADRVRERGGEPARAALVQARIPPAARRAHRRPHRRPRQPGRSAPTSCSSTGRGRCWSTCAAAACPSTWPAAPTSRVRQAGGRAARRRPRISGRDIYGASGRLQELLQEDGHRPHPPRERDPRRASCSRSATATSRSRTPRRSAAWRWPSPATRPTTAPAAWTSGNASGSSGVGADAVIPDFRDAAPLLELILGR